MPSLQDLPVELLTLIASYLCIHCTNAGPDLCWYNCYSVGMFEYDPEECYCSHSNTVSSRLQSRSLLNLCLVSRSLYSAVETILYHRPNTHKWWSLMGTLLARPDLARSVRELFLPRHVYCGDPGRRIAPEPVLQHINSVYVAHIASQERQSKTPIPSVGVDSVLEALADGGVAGGEGAVALVSLCPGLEKIERLVRLRVSLPYSPTDSLWKLKHLELVDWEFQTNGISLYTLAEITRAAPNLQQFRGYAVVGASHPTAEDPTGGLEPRLGELRDLELQLSVVNAGALEVLLKACPKLEAFNFNVGSRHLGIEQFDPGQTVELFEKFGGSSLKEVSVDFNHFDMAWEFDEWEPWPESKWRKVTKGFRDRGIRFEMTGYPGMEENGGDENEEDEGGEEQNGE